MKSAAGEFRSKVYTQRPAYADFETWQKFQAIEAMTARHLLQHPSAVCSYSGGADSDILMHLLERTRAVYHIPPIKYIFFNTGLEMAATKKHVKEMAKKYGVEIEEIRPDVNIVKAVREHGIPFVSKIMSSGLETVQRKGLPLEIHDEYWGAVDKKAKRKELKERYPNAENGINFLCCCNSEGEPRPNIQLVINSSKWMLDFIKENPIPFQCSAKCCDYCKKQPAHKAQRGYEMVITGERRDEGGMRSVPRTDSSTMCFTENSNGQYRFRPLYYVTDKDKQQYKERYGIRYSDAYEVYGMKRTGCCGCPISYRATEDLDLIKPFEPNVVKAAWKIFGDSYLYRQKYVEYKKRRETDQKQIEGQLSFFEMDELWP